MGNKISKLIVDIRETTAHLRSPIEGAIHIPEYRLQSRIGDLIKYDHVVLVCGSGTNARRWAYRLRDKHPNIEGRRI